MTAPIGLGINARLNCAREEPATPNFSRRHTQRARADDRRIRLRDSQFRRNRANRRSHEKNRGWLCKTSIPGSNPGGASKFGARGSALRADFPPAPRFGSLRSLALRCSLRSVRLAERRRRRASHVGARGSALRAEASGRIIGVMAGAACETIVG
jgi:hypothetical protein